MQTHVCQPFGQLHAVDPAAGSDVSFAADVDVHFTYWRGENAGRRGESECENPLQTMVICKGSVGKALTFTLQALLDDAPQQRTAVVAEGGRLVGMAAELVWDVNAEARTRGLEGDRT